MAVRPHIFGDTVAADARSEPVAALTQGELVESIHRGIIAVVDVRGRLKGGVGDPELPLFLRSAAKPFQALAVIESGAADAFSLRDEDLAVMCGSHAGRTEHVEVVEDLLGRLGVSPAEISCGPTTHMCSGKHAGMIAMALHMGVPVEGYADASHPVQREIARVIGALLKIGPRERGHREDVAEGSILSGIDGCGVPMIRLRLVDVAHLFALLGAGATPGLVRIRDAMLAHPVLVAGEGRLDTALMRAARGEVVAKVGAEGIYALGLPRAAKGKGDGGGRALGVVVKIEDGSARAVAPVVRSCLEAFAISVPDEVFSQTRHRTPEGIRGIVQGKVVSLVRGSDLWRGRVWEGAHELSAAGREGESLGDEAADAQVRVTVGRGDEKDVVRFLREEWPSADEQTFGRPLEWVAEPYALIMKRRRRTIAVLRGHFTGGVGSVDELMVGRDERRNGIGSMLLRRFEEEARRRACARSVLRAVKDSAAELFYRDAGYRRECVERDHEFGYDYVRLTKDLGSRGESGE